MAVIAGLELAGRNGSTRLGYLGSCGFPPDLLGWIDLDWGGVGGEQRWRWCTPQEGTATAGWCVRE